MALFRRAAVLAICTMLAATAGCETTTEITGSNGEQTATWIAQYRPKDSLGKSGTELAYYVFTGLSVVDSNVVFAAGDIPDPRNLSARVGLFARTADGGRTWTERFIEVPDLPVPTISGLHFINERIGWVVGAEQDRDGVLLKTTDGGDTWAATRLPLRQTPAAVFFVDELRGWVGTVTPDPLDPDDDEGLGGPSDLLATTDGGATWKSQRRVPVSITALHFLDQNNGWATGTRGAVYQTTDGGLTWTSRRSGLEPGDVVIDLRAEGAKMFALTGVHFPDQRNGFIAATSLEEDTGRVLATTNGGDTWSRMLVASDVGIRDVFFVSADQGWAVAEGGHYVYRTANGGQSWHAETIEFPQDTQLLSVRAADPSRVWAVGGGAIFFRVVK